MKIHQIQIRHDEAQDRLLMRFSTSDDTEFRFWLTRRFVKRLWGMLVQMMEWDQAVRQQVDPETKRTVLDIQHEGYSQKADYTRRYEEAPRRMPLGEAPILLARAAGKKGTGGLQMLSLYPQQGQGVDITLDTQLLHVFTRLLRQTVAKTDWDVDLALFHPKGDVTSEQAAAPRKLN